ncbi:septum formation initiator family protein, partial [Actinomadura geliboluensis]
QIREVAANLIRVAKERGITVVLVGHVTKEGATLSLAYPVREYIAQRKEIADLRQQEAVARRQVEQLALRKQQLGDKSYIEREATRRLHYCRPDVKCYIVLDGSGAEGRQAQRGGPARKPPWYETLWRSVEAADRPR